MTKQTVMTQEQFMETHTVTLSKITSGMYELRVYKGGHGEAIYEQFGYKTDNMIKRMLNDLNVETYSIGNVVRFGLRLS